MTSNRSGAKLLRSTSVRLLHVAQYLVSNRCAGRRPAAMSTPFTVEDTGEGESYTILPSVGEVANRMIDCEKHCTVARGAADEIAPATGSLLQSHRRQVGV